MERPKLNARHRTVVGKQVRALRRQGLIPAVLYGTGVEPTSLELESREASRVLSKASGSTLLDLVLENGTHNVLVREVQRDPILRDVRHVDFLKVAMDVAIRTSVPVELVGEAPAVKTFGGILVTGVDEIEVEALPADLPNRLTVDLGALTEIGKAITVGEIFPGKGVKVLTSKDELIARVTQAAAEEVVEEAPAVAVTAEPEVIEKPKKEEEVEEEAGE
jgi:large subunit ribosomal protein L25